MSLTRGTISSISTRRHAITSARFANARQAPKRKRSNSKFRRRPLAAKWIPSTQRSTPRVKCSCKEAGRRSSRAGQKSSRLIMPSDTVNEFTAGAFGGLAGLVVGHPCDTMKTITQNNKMGEMPFGKLMQQMRQMGAGAFFRGLSVPLWSYAVVNSVFFGAHKTMSKEMGIPLDAKSPEESFYFRLPPGQYLQLVLCGATAGLCQAIPSVPVEVIKVRMQKDAHLGARPTVRGTVVQIYREMGLRGFYTGISAQLARDVPASSLYFFSYEATRRSIRSVAQLPEWLNCVMAGAFAGWVSWFLPMPFDVIKTRLQSGRDKNFQSCVRALRADGPSAFFAGLGLVSIRAFLVNGVTFLGYEIAMAELTDRQEADSEEAMESIQTVRSSLIKSSTMAGSPNEKPPKS